MRNKICRTVLSSPRYAEKIDVITFNDDKSSTTCKTVALHIPQGTFDPSVLNCSIYVCECRGQIPKTKEITTIFSVASVNLFLKDNGSIILLEEMDFFSKGVQLHILREYFENVTYEYLVNDTHY